MEAIVEKLKVLESKQTSGPLSCRPPCLDRLSFVVKQPRQHELFLKVASWLCNQVEGDSTSTHRHTTVEALVADLSKRQLWGMAAGEEVAALKPGYGNAVCRVLDILCDAALVKIGFAWQTPVYLSSQEALHKAESKEAAPAKQEDAATTTPSFKPSQVEAKVAEAKEAAVRVNAGVAEGKGSGAGACPPRARDDESECKEQRYRERVNQVKTHIEEMETACQAKQGRVYTLRRELGRMQDRCDRLQHEEEEALRWEHPQGGGSTDQGGGGGRGMIHASPVVKVRGALQKVKEEIRVFDVRIGVVQHILLHRAGRLRGLEEEEEEEEEEEGEEERRRSENKKVITLH